MILLSPCGLQSVARGATLYSQLDTRHWSEGNRTITYEYDDNGSVTGKVIDDGNDTETFSYVYNLQNRLVKVTQTFSDSNEAEITEYKYDPQGIRVSKHTWSEVSGTPQNDDVTVVYLVDVYNHTGYTQVLEELVFNKANPDPLTETPDSRKTYTIGDDVITQYENGTGSEHLLYDGHGSTRQLADSDGTVAENYSYDGYGVMLGANANAADSAGTSMLYAGEQFDTSLQMYYNRARYYDQNIGRFNRLDPYSGNTQDPQSLHKYLYVHCNPVNNVDPSGEFTLKGLCISMAIGAAIGAIAGGIIARYTGHSIWKGILIGAGIGAATGALAYLLWSFGAAIKSGALKRFFYDSRTFTTISRQYWQRFGPASGRSLHHWLIPQRWSWISQGIRNAGFNLLRLPKLLPGSLGLNQWVGFAMRWGGTRMVVAVLVENGIRVLIPVTALASYHTGKWLGNEMVEKAIDLGEGASATPIDLNPAEETQMQEDAGKSLLEELK